MTWDRALEIINKAYEKSFEDKSFKMWLTLYPNMDDKNFMSFNDYKNKLMTPIVSTTPSMDDILKDVSELRQLKARKEDKK